MSDEGENTAEKLMGAFISKMENMDSDLRTLKQENLNLRKAIADPMNMLRKQGLLCLEQKLLLEYHRMISDLWEMTW